MKLHWLYTMALALGATALISGCSTMQIGSNSSNALTSGSAGGANSQNEAAGLEHCDRPLGTMTIYDVTRQPWYDRLPRDYQLGSTTPVLRLLAQQSNCFVIVERGRDMDLMMQERNLRDQGELRRSSNMQRGQLVAADFSLEPKILYSGGTSGASLGLGGIGGGWGALIGGLVGSFRTTEATTMLTLVDIRSGVQLAVAQGNARNTDFGFASALFGRHGGGALGLYGSTPQGKVIVGAFIDSFNGIVRAVRNYTAQRVEGGLGTGKGGLQVQSEDDNGAPRAEAPRHHRSEQSAPRVRTIVSPAAPVSTPEAKEAGEPTDGQ